MTSPNPTMIFDLDGTIADTIHDLVPSLNRTIATRDLNPVTVDQVGAISGKGIKPMLKLAYEYNGQVLDDDLMDKLYDFFLADYWEYICVDTRLFDNIHDRFEELKGNDWILGVCTNKPIKMAEKLLAELKIDHFFSAITGADSFEYRKPDPRHLLNTIELAGGAKTKAIMIGDSQTDIKTAHNAEVPVIAVDFGYSEEHVSVFNPTKIISHYDELDQAVREIWG